MAERKRGSSWHGFRYVPLKGSGKNESCTEMRQMNMIQTEPGNELFSYWLELKRNDTVPLQRTFDPARVRHHLPDLFILGKDDSGSLSFRLAGTRLCAMFGYELRGRPFTCLWHGTQRAQADTGIQAMLSRGRPMVTDVTGIGAETAHDYELVLLPMRSGELEQDRLMGAIFPRQPRTSPLLETLTCLYAGNSRTIAEQNDNDRPDGKRFSRFMRRLLSVEIVEDGLSDRR